MTFGDVIQLRIKKVVTSCKLHCFYKRICFYFWRFLMKKVFKICILFACLASFMSCVLESDDSNSSSETTEETSSSEEITSVTITGSDGLSYNGTTTFTAKVDYEGEETLTYEWKITTGSNYATLSGTNTKKVTFTANNTTDSEQSVIISVTVTAGSGSAASSKGASKTIELSANGESVPDAITSLTLTAASTSITSSGKTKLTATANHTGNPKITYSWEITNGADYAYFTSEGENSTTKTTEDDGDCKISGKNTTDSAQTVTIMVTASDEEGNSYSDSVSVTVEAKKANSDSYNTNATVDTATYSNVIYVDLESALVSNDNESWLEISTSAVQPIDNVKVKFTENDDGSSTGLIKINAASFGEKLAVYLSGTMTTGGVKIQSNASDVVAVYLNDAKITSSNYPCVEVTKGSEAIVNLSGTNVFVDGRSYGTGYGEEYSTSSSDTYTDDDGNTVSCTVVKAAQREGSDGKGTLYSKGSLTISGSGSLSVTQSYKNCIATKGILTINGGTYTLTSTGKSGLYGDSSVVVNDGAITFNGTGSVSSSTFRKANGIKTDTDDTASSVYINGGTLNVTTYNGKGINSSKVYIAGGTNTFNVTGVTNYTNDSNTKISYYDADGVYYSNVSVNFAAEGIEGASIVEIDGGTTEVTATDDGINVSDSSAAFYMKGGNLYSYAIKGDGIDSNGNLYIQGGVVVSYAQTGSEDSFDSGSKIYVTGGTFAGTSGSQMALSEYNTSGQKVLYFTGSSREMGGVDNRGGPGQPTSSSSTSSSFSAVAVKVSGSTVYAFKLPSSSFGLFVMSCPSFTSSSSSSYTVYTAPTISNSDFNGLCTTSSTLNAVSVGSSTSSPSIK